MMRFFINSLICLDISNVFHCQLFLDDSSQPTVFHIQFNLIRNHLRETNSKIYKAGRVGHNFFPPFHFLPCWDSYSLLRALWQNRSDNAAEWERSLAEKVSIWGKNIFGGGGGKDLYNSKSTFCICFNSAERYW